MNPTAIQATTRPGNIFKSVRVLQGILAGLYIWISLIKLPATAYRDSSPQSWEAVLSFAAAHHLQWGTDIVFTFGPLGYLASDYYWGNLFAPIVLWALGFALVLTGVILPFLRRAALYSRVPFYAALPLLTVPLSQDLGFDAVYLLCITLLGVACLPGEQPGVVRLITTGVTFAFLTSIKFTFSIYCVSALLVIGVSNGLAGRLRNAGILTASWAAAFVTIWWSCGQKISGIPLFISRSLEIVSGYSSAMSLSPDRRDIVFGVVMVLLLAGLSLCCWFGSQDWKRKTDRAAIVAGGIFLAWKEGFVRADVHVVVFFVYAFFLAVLLPALMGQTESPISDNPAERKPSHFRWLPRLVLPLATATLFLSLIPFATYRKSFGRAVQNGFAPRFSDTFTALFAPATFKQRLESHLETMRRPVSLPEIKATVGDASVAVLSYDQDVAILNGLNYAPHPVFQSYSAYTPGLQRLNAVYFSSDGAPDYVLWRTGTVDMRLPALDDGEVFLKIHSAYSPAVHERGFTLWKRDPSGSDNHSLVNGRDFVATIDQWFAVANEPTWCRLELRQTYLGKLTSLLWSSCVVQIELQLEDGKTLDYRLPPGNARSGFVLNPLLEEDVDRARSPVRRLSPARVVAARVRVGNGRMFDRSIHAAMATIQGVPMLDMPPDAAGLGLKSNEN